MSIKPKVAALVVTAVAAAGLGAVTASDGASAAGKSYTWRFNAISDRGHPVGTAGFVGTDIERRHGNFRGYDTVSGHFNVKTQRIHLYVAVARRGGLVYVRGVETQGGTFTGRVTGGTGIYKGATGTVTGQQAPHNNNVTHIVAIFHT